MKTHGLSKTSLYHRWICMKDRCSNPKSKSYPSYGGRGISVCKEWNESFEAFYEWAIGSGFDGTLTLDRIDNNKNYYPENCRWVSIKEQNRNCSRNNMITHNGKTQCVTDWARELGIRPATIYDRLHKGMTIEEALDKAKFKHIKKARG